MPSTKALDLGRDVAMLCGAILHALGIRVDQGVFCQRIFLRASGSFSLLI
jgi:hypothetical protein